MAVATALRDRVYRTTVLNISLSTMQNVEEIAECYAPVLLQLAESIRTSLEARRAG